MFKNGNRLVIVESKGGASELAETAHDGLQMSRKWIEAKIKTLRGSLDVEKKAWSDELNSHLNAGTLDAMVVRTPRVNGVVGDPLFEIKTNVQTLGKMDGGWTV